MALGGTPSSSGRGKRTQQNQQANDSSSAQIALTQGEPAEKSSENSLAAPQSPVAGDLASFRIDTKRSGPTPSPPVAPIYKRLPRGPSKMNRNEVIRNQRARIHGAMIEAVARNGYQKTSVKEVIALAGVSRRAFYELFANKENCFLVTFDSIVRHEIQQIIQTYLATTATPSRVGNSHDQIRGDPRDHVHTWETRARAAFEKCGKTISDDQGRARLVLLEAQTVGPDGLLHLSRATSACEQMLARSFAESPDATALPMPMIWAIAGGLYGIAAGFLRDGHTTTRDGDTTKGLNTTMCDGHTTTSLNPADEMLHWTLPFQTPETERMAENMAAALSIRIRKISSTNGHGPSDASANGASMNGQGLGNGHGRGNASANGASTNGHGLDNGHGRGDTSANGHGLGNTRTRLLHAALLLATQEDYRTLSVPQIADAANVSIDNFNKLFVNQDDCFLAALNMISTNLLRIAADPDLVGNDWAHAVRRVLAELMSYLTDHPLHARILTQEAFSISTESHERVVELSLSIATLLTEGAPTKAQGKLTTEAVAGAIWHTIRCQTLAGKTQLLGALSDYLAYVILTPFIGANTAIETLTEESQPAQTSPHQLVA